jgi:hypothetical protein
MGRLVKVWGGSPHLDEEFPMNLSQASGQAARRCSRRLVAAALLGSWSAAVILSGHASAQTPITWNGTSGASWAVNGNWLGGLQPTSDQTSNTAVFTATTSGSVNVNTPRSIAGLDIDRDVAFYGSTLTLGPSAALSLAANTTATFGNQVARGTASGTFALADGSALTFNAQSPNGGIYELTNATINFNGNIGHSFNPDFFGSGTLNYGFSGTAGTFRFNIRDSANLVIKATSGGDGGSAAATYLRYYGPGSLTLERDFTMLNVVSGGINVQNGALSVQSSSAAIVTVAGGYTGQFNQLVFLSTVNGTFRLDGSTLQIGDGTVGKVQGVFVGSTSGQAVNNTSRVYTLDASATGGTVRVTGSSTFNNFVTGTVNNNYGAQLALTGPVALYNNGNWQNQNLTTSAILTGIDVGATATLGGTGTFNMAAANGSNAKNTFVNGIVAPGDPTLSAGIGVLAMQTGTLGFNAGSTFASQVDSSAALSAGADLLQVIGDLSLAGTVGLTLADVATSPLAFAPSTTFSLLNYTGGWNGGLFSYAGAPVPDGGTFTAGLNTWQLDYGATSGGSNFSGAHTAGSFVNISIVVVPEPEAIALAGLGAALAAWHARRRQRG